METMPLKAALAAAGTTFARFHYMTGRADFDRLLSGVGAAPADHLPEGPTGPGAGQGNPRSISIPAAVMLAIASRLVERRIEAPDALRIAAAFAFLGEMGNGLRAIVPADQAAAREPGALFPHDLGETFLLVIPARLDAPEAQAVAIVPARDLNARNLVNWAGMNDADMETVVLLNLSAVVAHVAAAARAA